MFQTDPALASPVTVRTGSIGRRPLVAGADPRTIDTTGVTWVYTMPQPLTFIRQKVVLVKVSGPDATLSEGPPVGTAVVTKGVAELYGAELGVGK